MPQINLEFWCLEVLYVRISCQFILYCSFISITFRRQKLPMDPETVGSRVVWSRFFSFLYWILQTPQIQRLKSTRLKDAQRHLALMPGSCVTLEGKGVFADVIKHLETERLSWIIQVDPKSTHRWDGQRAIWPSQKRRRRCNDRGRDCSDAAPRQARRGTPPAARSQKRQGSLCSLLRASAGSADLLTLWFQSPDIDFRFLASRTVREEIAVLKSRYVCGDSLQQMNAPLSPTKDVRKVIPRICEYVILNS